MNVNVAGAASGLMAGHHLAKMSDRPPSSEAYVPDDHHVFVSADAMHGSLSALHSIGRVNIFAMSRCADYIVPLNADYIVPLNTEPLDAIAINTSCHVQPWKRARATMRLLSPSKSRQLSPPGSSDLTDDVHRLSSRMLHWVENLAAQRETAVQFYTLALHGLGRSRAVTDEIAAADKATVTAFDPVGITPVDLLRELDRYATEPANWDGQGALVPNEDAINDAKYFVRAATKHTADLALELDPDGTIWIEIENDEDADEARYVLRFVGDRRVHITDRERDGATSVVKLPYDGNIPNQISAILDD